MKPGRKQERRYEATVRQVEHDKLTTEQKMEKAMTRPGNSTRELARLDKLLGKGE